MGTGSKRLPSLTQTAQDDFKADPENSLTTKYLEVIRITKALGFQHIWIDSLCIIQDSAEDWIWEAKKILAVSGRSSCNISYVYLPSYASTKRHLRDPSISLPCRLFPGSTPLEPDATPSLVVQTTDRSLVRHWSANSFKVSWPLLSRAWVFQERLLRPALNRTPSLYFTTSRICLLAFEHQNSRARCSGTRAFFEFFPEGTTC